MSAWQQQWQQQWQQSREQWQANPRLRWGVWTMLFIMLLWLNLVASDWRTGLAGEQQQAAEQWQQQQTLAGSQHWQQRLEQARAATGEQSRHFGKAASESLARADVQARVAAELARLGLEKARIEVSAAPAADAATGLVPLQLRVSGQAGGDRLLALVQALEQGSPLLRIEQVTANNQRGRYVIFSLTATVWYHPFGADS